MIPFEVIALSPYAREWLTEHARRRRGRRLRDRLRRVIEVGEAQPDDWNGLLSLYSSFGFAQRTQGMPSLGPDRQAAWVDELLKRGPNVVARFAGRIIGHAALVAYDHATSYELVVFVHRDYQGVGIGGAVLDALLRLARRRGVERVWLTVERENRRAAALYRGRGFRPLRDHSADK
jgi:ribosomal protein S18 acetylase RimI-like enzyme